ncbi:hypothetical protein NHG32_02285 [Aerococcaceae bacterium NML191219]|nr:hypothetical protein [Aerococcaceae bacterium NML191219]
MIIDVSKIEELFNSSITTYQIAKACDLSTQTLDRYRASDGKLENMSLKIALKIMNYIKQEEQEMNSNYKKVINKYGEEATIDLRTRKVYKFNNRKQEIEYNAAIVENGETTTFYTDYVEKGTVDDLETKINSFGNPVALIYATAVNFNAEENDKDKKIWNALLEGVRANESKIFTKSGDFKKKIAVESSDLIITKNSDAYEK